MLPCIWPPRAYRAALLALAALALTACGAQAPAQSGPTPPTDSASATGPTPAAEASPSAVPTTSPPTAAAEATREPTKAAASTATQARPTTAATRPAQSSSPTLPADATTGEVPPALLAQIKADLASRSGVAADAIVELMGKAVEWRDSSLGCPEPDVSYLQVITPGYQVMLQAGDKTYDYHASENAFLLCEPKG